uniref:Uncharacterized protein n=1 Tax=Anopheles epiroticus TaxID=199890 RepID=A0A182P1T8_9DIPT
MKQPMSKTQRLKNIFAKRMLRGGSGQPEENIAPTTTPDVAAVDEQDTKPTQGSGKLAKDDQMLVYAELELKPAGGEISFVNKPAASNEPTEYAEILYVQQQAGTTAGSEAAQQPEQQQQPQQPHQVQRHHSSEDNRPVIDVSLQKPSTKSEGGKTASGGK